MRRNLRSLFYNHLWKFVVFIVLLSLNFLVIYKTYRTYREEPQYYYIYHMLGDSLCVARASAVAICLNMLAVMVSMCKIFVSFARNLLSKFCLGGMRRLLDEKKSMHIMCGMLVCFLSIIHTVAHCVNNLNFCNNFDEQLKGLNLFPKREMIGKYSVFFTTTGLTGILMLLILLIMFTSSLASVRRQNYVIFWYTHHLAFPFIGLLILHSYGCIIKRQKNIKDHWPGCVYTNQTLNSSTANVKADGKIICKDAPLFEHDPAQAWKWILLPLFFYIFDRLIRRWRGSKKVEIRKAVWHKGNVVELHLSQTDFAALPGQYIQVQCPEIAKFEWHPFTLTRCPLKNSADETFSVHIKVLGKWTEALSNKLFIDSTPTSTRKDSLVEYSHTQSGCMTKLVQAVDSLNLFVDGPYGSPCQDIEKYSVSVCIAAGIGVTPFAAVINSLRQKLEKGKLRRLYFIWISREIDTFHWFLELLHEFYSELTKMNKADFLVCKFYLTRSFEDCEKGLPSSQDVGAEWLQSRLNFGRPKWENVFNQISSNHRRERIGVFYTGPRGISPILLNMCNNTTRHGNSFIYHKDSFG